MAWTINGIRIYPQTLEDNSKQIIARLQPLSTGTIIQTFGYESPIYQMSCKVVGDTNLDAIKALRTTGLTYTLAGNDGFSKTVYVVSINASRDAFAYQTIDQAQDCTTPVYTVSLEFYE